MKDRFKLEGYMKVSIAAIAILIVTVICAVSSGNSPVDSKDMSPFVQYTYTPSTQTPEEGIKTTLEGGKEVDIDGLICIALSPDDQIQINKNINELLNEYKEIEKSEICYGLIKSQDNINSLSFFIYNNSEEEFNIANSIAIDLLHIFANNNIEANYEALEVGLYALVNDNYKLYDSFGFEDAKRIIQEIKTP